MALGPVGTLLEQKLISALHPSALTVIDESHHHHGHAGSHPEGESHFRIQIMADVFRGKSRVDQHRMVNAVLKNELATRVHALAIESTAPPG